MKCFRFTFFSPFGFSKVKLKGIGFLVPLETRQSTALYYQSFLSIRALVSVFAIDFT